ncbi:PHD finger protein 7-like [Drosophila rhopaloa]|uniref:PHD-type domain-containing protein n=1 Tax=Drosophila rhopaloa TaxID=1041015 RepID=A0ABM5JBJ8_DRORH|nr:PHD finger protein 7-like [Drosophila rhopaloa]
MEEQNKLKCDICDFSSGHTEEETLLYGDWMVRKDLRVHYFCLLLSSNLPQSGGDASGILGFLLRDIRQTVAIAKKTKCSFCNQVGATIRCHGCQVIFHMKCGIINRCTFQFCGPFHSYCSECMPMDDYQRQIAANRPKLSPCDICLAPILNFSPHNIVYGDCCHKGFAHKTCMRKYALSAGYYLRCIWCRSDKFRETVRLQSIFVPDRDANWELQQNAYRELHERKVSCDLIQCICPKGRAYNKSSWLTLACKLCASTGAHAKCLAGTLRLNRRTEPTEFKCVGCLEVERRLSEGPARNLDASITGTEGHVDASFYVLKTGPQMPALGGNMSPVFSEDYDTDSINSTNCSNTTVIPSQPTARSTSVSPLPNIAVLEIPVSPPPEPIIEIPESPPQPVLADENPYISTNNLMVIPSQPDVKSASVSSGPSITSPPQEAVIAMPDLPPRLMLKRSFRCAGEPFFYLVMFEFEHITCLSSCAGSCTFRFHEDDPRIQDISQEALQRVKVTPADIWFRDKESQKY